MDEAQLGAFYPRSAGEGDMASVRESEAEMIRLTPSNHWLSRLIRRSTTSELPDYPRTEKIVCPQCNRYQLAQVHFEAWMPFPSKCEVCGFLITESEWVRVNPRHCFCSSCGRQRHNGNFCWWCRLRDRMQLRVSSFLKWINKEK